jgi:hypothetical protein
MLIRASLTTLTIVVVVLARFILTGYRFHRKACDYRDRIERLEGGVSALPGMQLRFRRSSPPGACAPYTLVNGIIPVRPLMSAPSGLRGSADATPSVHFHPLE